MEAAEPGEPVPVVAVVGPTAAGKSALALELALVLPGEVVNADSMQLYRGMDIGTAKLPPPERRGVPHHLIDILGVTETSTVAEFQRAARAAIADCRRRAVVPVLVGGSALYLQAVLDDLDFPGTRADVRRHLEADLAAVGPAALHRRLAERDPAAAAAILPSNGRRIVRALEVGEITGRPFNATLPAHRHALAPPVVQLGLDVPRDVLDARIEERVRRMWAAGFLEEVRALRERGLATSRTASRALGYRQLLAALAGECTEEEAYAGTVLRTRRFARRQDSWFRRDPRIEWIPYDAPDRLARALELVRAASAVPSTGADGLREGTRHR